MADKITAEVCVLVDACGDYAVGKDEADAREAYENTIQALTDCDGFRLVKLCVAVPLGAVVELTREAPTVEPAGTLTALNTPLRRKQ
jgi:hypothetical protein